MEPLRVLRALALEFTRPGEGDLPPRLLQAATTFGLSLAQIVTNVIGALIVVALLLLRLVPLPPLGHVDHVRLVNAIVAAVYVLVALPVGWWFGYRAVSATGDWLTTRRRPTDAEVRAVLYAPRRLFALQVVLWLLAAGVFSGVDTQYSGALAVRVAIVVILTGFVTAACAYLSAERLLRSLTARALQHGTPAAYGVPGVVTRTLLAWGLGTVVPIGGLASIGIVALADGHSPSRHDLAVSILALTCTGILVGLTAVLLAVRTTAEPISSVRRALGRVREGDLDVRVPVYDVSEIGQLQLGFNAMVEGLAERERIREMFGTYVDPEVAEKIIESGSMLSGETVEVTCMFIDVREFTAWAERTPAETVVAALNALFDRCVPIIHQEGGRIDKFVGDGLLAVFGAPRRLEDHADRALAAARHIARIVADPASASAGPADSPLRIGVGLNSGPVVAGNVGGGGRFEFSVIGDTVNVAARVEAATRQTGDTILLSEHTRDHLHAPPALVQREGLVLKGKTDAVRIYALTPGRP